MHMHGPTKYFFDDPAHDRLLAMILSLGAELAAAREEMSALRSLLANKGVVAAADLAEFSTASQAERDAMRERLVANLLFPLQQECQSLVDKSHLRKPT